MKKLFTIVALSVALVAFASCGNKNVKTQQEGTHTHADGTACDGDHSKDAEVKQEKFTDTTTNHDCCADTTKKTQTHTHDHSEKGHKH